MEYPTYYERARETVMQTVFGGYNRSPGAAEAEFLNMENMSSKRYPYLSPRYGRGRRLFDYALNITGMSTAWGPSGEYIAIALNTTSTGQTTIRTIDPNTNKAISNVGLDEYNVYSHTFVNMGAYTVIFPTKKIMKLDETGYPIFENLENETIVGADVPSGFGNVGYYMCDLDALNNGLPDMLVDDDVWRDETIPQDPENGQIWLDRSAKMTDPYGSYVGQPMVYSELNKMWVDLYPTYVKLAYPGIGKGFSAGDTVTITVPNSTAGPIKAIEGNKKIEACGDDYIVVQGILDYSEVNLNTVVPQHIGISVKRAVPDMDLVIESGNRLWGCKSGIVEGEWLNEIYVSALGDPKNWNKFEGIASDSYAVSIGKQGKFTGAITYNDVPHFFKERCVIKVYGTAPSNFETLAIPLDGVEEGSANSLAVVDGVVYYKSRRGIMAYSGNSATLISREFGETVYKNAVGGEFDGKYYVCLESEGDKHDLFVFDPWRNMWHREDATKVDSFARAENRLYANIGGYLRTIVGDDTDFEWFAESTPIGLSDPDYKYISQIRIRAYIPEGASLDVSFAIGDDAPFMMADSFRGGGLCTRLVVPVPDRCDHLRVRYSGKGDVDIYSIAYDYERGSDV